MSRRNRSARRRTYGKRQHEVQERRPSESREGDWPRRDEDLSSQGLIEEVTRRDSTYDAEGWAR
ncbi:MAG TPA: hypothetical protein VM284_02245 [Candidatus Limnocylindria bacterium]|nr:hypothetical protein [Candidatus Limnocylindria bacterium]